MRKTNENQHRWKRSLNPRTVEVLEEAAQRLEVSWEWDRKDPESYPINTDHVLCETVARLRAPSQVQPTEKGLPPSSPPAKSVHDLIDESTVRTLYEQQHAGSYERALKQASEGFSRGFAAWRKIANSLTAAYRIDFGGTDFIPKPRVHFLHRELLDIAKMLELDQLTSKGLVEFLDDVCPCGKKHTSEALRKLGKRLAKSRQI